MRRRVTPDEGIDVLDRWTDLVAEAADGDKPRELALAIARGLETLYALEKDGMPAYLARYYNETAVRFLEVVSLSTNDLTNGALGRVLARLRARNEQSSGGKVFPGQPLA